MIMAATSTHTSSTATNQCTSTRTSTIMQRSRSNSTTSAVVDSVVDAHASRLLRINSPAEACIDPALGPYVTSILRCAMGSDLTLELDDIDEMESLLELLEEHCTMDKESAKNALLNIYRCVKTGDVDDISSLRRPRGLSAGNEEDSIRLLGQMLRDSDLAAGNRVLLLNDKQPPHMSTFSVGAGEFKYNPMTFPPHDLDFGFAFETDDILNEITDLRESREVKRSMDNSNAIFNNASDASIALPSTPLKTLIPTDLLGVLNNPSTPATRTNNVTQSPTRNINVEMETPKIRNENKNNYQLISISHCASCSQSQSHLSPELKILTSTRQKDNASPISKESLAHDLAATLFKPTRSRSNSLLSDRSPKFKPMQAPPSPGQIHLNSSNNANQQQLTESTIQMLLSLNSTLSEEAARKAAQVTNNDVNVAQYVLEKAMAAPPVCRHMLNNACYRSDCQFSHDVEGHTCLFWLKGRCGKGDACRFYHGFSEHLLEGMMHSTESKSTTGTVFNGQKTMNIPITTTNLVQHNMSCASTQPFSFMPSSLDSMNSCSAEEAFGGGAFSLSIPQTSSKPTTPAQSNILSSTVLQNRTNHFESHYGDTKGSTTTNSSNRSSNFNNEQLFPTMHDRNFPSIPKNERRPMQDRAMGSNDQSSNYPKSFSFARVASKGYNKVSSFASSSLTKEQHSNGSAPANITSSSTHNNHKTTKYAKIPQDLWHAHYSRNSSYFHISDPMERYYKVSSSSNLRLDVIDLHFQSIKTFPVVLSRVLPDKLQQKSEVWVVTGSGHHVHRNSHQKPGGVLETAVIRWLSGRGYEYLKGKDKNGYGGAILVKERR